MKTKIVPGMMVRLYSARQFFQDIESNHRCIPSYIPTEAMVMYITEGRSSIRQSMVRVMYKEVAGWISKNYTPDEDIELWELFKVVINDDP